MNAKHQENFKRAAQILAQNKIDTASYAKRHTETGDSPRKKAAIKKLLKNKK